MSDVDLKEFLGAFLAEADEHVAVMNAKLLALDTAVRRSETNPRAVRDLFRALHTIKGLSAMVGVEPIVGIAHRMEAIVRAVDRGATMTVAGVDVLLQGARAIEQRVRLLAKGAPVQSAPAALFEALESLDTLAPASAAATAADGAVTIDPAIAKKLTSSELEQLVRGVAAGRRAVCVEFVPSPQRAAEGVTINAVRASVGAVGEIVRVLPRAVTVSENAPGGLAFAIVLSSSATNEEIARAASSDLDHLTVLAEPSAPAFVDAEPALDESTPDVGDARRDVLRVEVARVDDAMERLSLLIVNRSRLARAIATLTESGAPTRELGQVLADQTRQLRDLRASILRVRMVRMSAVLDRVPLIVRALARTTRKQVRLQLDAGSTELDKAVADRIFPALVHLVRNAVDHGIEAPAERRAAGKSEEGTVRVDCMEHSSARLEIQVSDDGAGVDRSKVARRAQTPVESDGALLDVLCRPGISTRDEVTTTSGRGMGMDIVRRTIVDELGGELEIRTKPGEGTTFVARVPLTISIVDAFTLECSSQRFVVPVSMVEELVEIDPTKVVYGPTAITGAERRGVGMLQRRGEAVPLIELATALRLDRPKERARKALVVRRAGEPMAFGLDRVLGQQEAVVRPLEDPLLRVPGIAGATDLGDGRPTLVLDLVTLSAHVGTLRPERAA